MAKVIPFKGLSYSDKYSKKMGELITPPYDIITPSAQQKFYKQHDYNIIRLELGKSKLRDNETNNRYTRARQILKDWLNRQVLTVDNKPAYYFLQSEYKAPNGEMKSVRALYALVELEELNGGKILPHENTYAGPKADRFNLLKETGVSFSPVYALYRDPSAKITMVLNKVMRRKPKLEFKDWDQATHRVWIINKPDECEAIQLGFRGKKLLIADGHHRYSTALSYKNTYGATAGEQADYVMMCLTETNDPGLTVLPVYRLVNGVSRKQWNYFKTNLEDAFDIEKVSTILDLPRAQAAAFKASKQPVIGYIPEGGKEAYLLKIKKETLESFSSNPASGHSRIFYRLDVVVLNQIILEALLGIIPGEEKDRLSYTKNLGEAVALVKKSSVQAAFLPGLPNLNAIWDLAKKGETMPQKSTYFLPKLVTGIVMNPVNIDRS